MNARIKKLWVAALRSGKWRKAKGQLRKSTNYRCCLGVLDEVYMEDTGRGEWCEGIFTILGEGGETYFLGTEVMEWAGLDGHPTGGTVEIRGEKVFLANHNDGFKCRPKTQLEIADAIEAQL